MEPPYPGAWVAAIVVLLLAVEALVLNRMWSERHDTMAAAPVAAPLVVSPPGAPPVPPAPEEARVRVRDLPPRTRPKSNAPSATGNVPSVLPPGLGNVPGNVPIIPAERLTPPADPEPALTPAPSLEPTPAPATQPERVPVAPVEPPRPRPRPAPEPRRVREGGQLSLYFDADSSTYARHHERMPLRVEVYVDGAKRVDSTDPEKREFPMGQLPAGRHEVRIVPYVGDYPSEPFVGVVRVSPGEASTYKAVLRKAHDVSRISKFEPRD